MLLANGIISFSMANIPFFIYTHTHATHTVSYYISQPLLAPLGNSCADFCLQPTSLTASTLSGLLKAGHWRFLIVTVPAVNNGQLECSFSSKWSQMACHTIIMCVSFSLMVRKGGLNFAINTLFACGIFLY